jgi:dipeptidyl aminopeptidase/acylaminoacyl peptidase
MDIYFWAAIFTIFPGITSLILFYFYIKDRAKEARHSSKKPQQKEQYNIIVPELLQKQRAHKSKRKVALISGITLGIVCIASGITFIATQLFSSQLQAGPIDTPYQSSVKALSWSPDEKHIVSASSDGVRIWDVTTHQNYSISQSSVSTVAWSPKGNFVAFGDGKTVQVWNIPTNRLANPYLGHADDVRVIAWSPDGKRIASGDDASVQIWNIETRQLIVKHPNSTPVNTLSWSYDGRRIATGDNSGLVQVWAADSGKTIFDYPGVGSAILSVSWSPTALLLVSAGGDTLAKVWDTRLNSNSPIKVYNEHSDAVNGIGWSPDGNDIVSVSNDGTIRVWEALTGKDISIYYAFRNRESPGDLVWVTSVAWSIDGQSIAFGQVESTISGYAVNITVRVITLCRSWCFFR